MNGFVGGIGDDHEGALTKDQKHGLYLIIEFEWRSARSDQTPVFDKSCQVNICTPECFQSIDP